MVPSNKMLPRGNRPSLSHYSDLWGFKNFAMARLLTESEASLLHPDAFKNLEKGALYLELTHHPSIKEARIVRDEMNRLRPDLGVSVSLLPLQKCAGSNPRRDRRCADRKPLPVHGLQADYRSGGKVMCASREGPV